MDDDATSREILQEMLASFSFAGALEILAGAGLKVTVAGNGPEALAILRNTPFDAVLMDVQMLIPESRNALL